METEKGSIRKQQNVGTVVDREQRMNRWTDGQMDEPHYILIQLTYHFGHMNMLNKRL